MFFKIITSFAFSLIVLKKTLILISHTHLDIFSLLKGTVGGQCDELTGKCRCLDGFEGDHCDRCKPGYYNFPNCQACNCHPDGTDPAACKYVSHQSNFHYVFSFYVSVQIQTNNICISYL